MEHPIYDLQRLVREHEMALSKVAAFHNSDVSKTLANLKDYVHGVMDGLPGTGDLTDEEKERQEIRIGERALQPQSIDKAKEALYKPGSGLDKDVPVGAPRMSDGEPQTQKSWEQAQKADAPDVTKLTFAEVNELQPK